MDHALGRRAPATSDTAPMRGDATLQSPPSFMMNSRCNSSEVMDSPVISSIAPANSMSWSPTDAMAAATNACKSEPGTSIPSIVKLLFRFDTDKSPRDAIDPSRSRYGGTDILDGMAPPIL